MCFLLIFFCGVYIGHNKDFPYDILFYLKNFEKYNHYIPTRNFKPKSDTLNPLKIKLTKNTGVFITYGQSNSTCGGELGYKVKNDVYHSIFGHTYFYEDPTIGSTGNGGSVWGMVGDKLIDLGYYDKIVFSNCGFGGQSIVQLKKLKHLGFLIMNYQFLISKYGKVDGILFHQGESDNSHAGVKTYYNNFLEMLETLKEFGIEVPIYLSRASYCTNKFPINTDLTKIQNQLISDFELVRQGPNTDTIIKEEYRIDDCHFSLKGFEIFSDLWVNTLKNNATLNQRYQ